MAELMREVMEKANTLDDAIRIHAGFAAHVSYYYVISDGNTKQAVASSNTRQIHHVKPARRCHSCRTRLKIPFCSPPTTATKPLRSRKSRVRLIRRPQRTGAHESARLHDQQYSVRPLPPRHARFLGRHADRNTWPVHRVSRTTPSNPA